jgi:hypothetical protein
MKDVCVQLEPLAGGSRNFYISDCTELDGSFTLDEMPPGQYRLVANKDGRPSGREPFRATYYPGTEKKEEATILTIGLGEHLEKLQFRIPSLLKQVKISGNVNHQDARPVVDQGVTFKSSNGEAAYAKTDALGHFELIVLAGESGDLYSDFMVFRDDADKCPQFQAQFNPKGYGTMLKSNKLTLTPDRDVGGIVLTYPFPSCKDWPEKSN